jgi:hypothetical protein
VIPLSDQFLSAAEQVRVAASVRATIIALGESDPFLLRQRIQVRGRLLDSGMTHKFVLIAFGELAAEGVLETWWQNEGAPLEDAVVAIRSFGMSQAVPRTLLEAVLGSPPRRVIRAFANPPAAVVGSSAQASTAAPVPPPVGVSVKPPNDRQGGSSVLYERFAAIQTANQEAVMSRTAFSAWVTAEGERLRRERGWSDVAFRVEFFDGRAQLVPTNGGLKDSEPVRLVTHAPKTDFQAKWGAMAMPSASTTSFRGCGCSWQTVAILSAVACLAWLVTFAVSNWTTAVAPQPPPRASLQVKMLEPLSAEVRIDGRVVGKTDSIQREIAPGLRPVTIHAVGYRDRDEKILFEAGQVTRLLDVRLQPLPIRLKVNANVVGADIFVDNQLVGKITGGADTFEVPATAKSLVLSSDGYADTRLELQLTAGEPAVLNAVLTPEPLEGSADPEGSGGLLSRDEVRETISKSAARIAACARPETAGSTVRVRFLVASSGSVSEVESLDGGSVGECVAGIVATLRFRAFSGNAVTISYPFTF